MGTYRQPGVIKDTRFETARAAGEQISKTIVEDLEKKKKAEEMLKLKKQKLNESMYGLQLDVSKVPAASDKSLTASLRKTLNNELQHIYQLGLESLKTGDNSEYLAAKSKFEGFVSKLPEQIGNLDYEANMYSKKGDQVLTYGNDPMLAKMLDNYNMEDGKDIEITYDRGTGTGIYSYTDVNDKGKSVNTMVNMDYNLKNIKSGGSGLMKYMDDPSDSFSKLWSKVSKGYKPYTFQQEEIGRGGQDVIATYQNYDDANEDIKKELTDASQPNFKDPFANQYNQNNWEFFGNKTEFLDTEEQREKLRNTMVDYMITNYGKRSETRTKEELLTEKNKSTSGSATQRKINSAKAFGRKYFKRKGGRTLAYDGEKMAKGLNDARHTASQNREKVKYFTVKDLLTTYSDSTYDEVRNWIKSQGYSDDDVLRANIDVLDSVTAKIAPTAVPNLFVLMNSIDDFENSYNRS
jgi:hypothetical protein